MGLAMWKKGAALALLSGVIGAPAMASDIALVIGNRDYRDAAPVFGAEEVVEAADALNDNDVTVVARTNATLADMRALVGQFEQMAPSADALLVVLAGRFIQGGNDTFFLPVDEDRAGLTGLPAQSLPLSSVLQILSTAPGEAVLVLAEDGRDDDQGPFLREGVGHIDVPQGVTVVQGAPRPVAGLLRDVLAVPGAPLARDDDAALSLSGFLPDGYSFLHDPESDSGVSAADLAAAQSDADRQRRRAERAERDASAARSATRQAQLLIARADEALWRVAREKGSADGYDDYVDVFPDGNHATEARRLISEFRGEPFRNARLAEEALSLSRDQRRAIQRDLTDLGFNTRGVDGIFGAGTRRAIGAWQARAGREQSGYLDRVQIDAISRDAQQKQAQAEAEEAARQAEARRRDDAFWRQSGAGQTEDGLRRYLERYAQGQWADVARNRLAEIEQSRQAADDDAYWQRLGAGRTEEALRRYLDRYPRGRWAQEARNRLSRVEQARADESRREEARRQEEARREKAKREAEVARENEARNRDDNRYWQQTGAGGNEEGLRAYLKQYPDGVHAREARDRINQILLDRGVKASRSEQVAWERATAENTVTSYRKYVGIYPKGHWAGDAKARIAQLEQGSGGVDDSAREGEARLSLNQALRLAVENRLSALGFDVGPVDGTFDRATRQAFVKYQRANNLPTTGYLSEPMVVQLLQDSLRNLLR